MGKQKLVAWLGNGFFRTGLEARDWTFIRVPFARGRDVLDYPAIVQRTGREPDVFLYADMSVAPPVVGLESFPCPTVFYCVDSHIHSWYPLWAQAFDFCLVSLKDHIPQFLKRLDASRVLWTPPMPMDTDRPDPEASKEWDLLFAGKVSPEVTPVRAAFLEELGSRIDGLVVRQGAFHELFPQARLVLNIAERGDLNFRVFEALACRSCLITPMVGHGMTDLFTPGRHLFTYEPQDMDGLVRLVRTLLADEVLREATAQRGYEAIESGHRISHRAAAFVEMMERQNLGEVVAERLAIRRDIQRTVLRPIHLHWAEALADKGLAAKYLEAARLS